MHWLKTPNADLRDTPATDKENQGYLAIHIFVFHQNKMLLLHNSTENKWVLPSEVYLPNSTQKTLSKLCKSDGGASSTSGNSLQDVVIQSLQKALKDKVLGNLQFTDLLFGDAAMAQND